MMTMDQHNSMVHDIVIGTMCELTRWEKIDVLLSCTAMANDEPEYPTRVPIDTDNLAEPF